MNRDEIRRIACERIAWMDVDFSGHHVTEEQLAYYRLLTAIYRADLGIYYEAFGWAQINESDALDGKYDLGWGETTLFEKHVIGLINADISKKEAEVGQRSFSDPRPIRPDLRA